MKYCTMAMGEIASTSGWHLSPCSGREDEVHVHIIIHKRYPSYPFFSKAEVLSFIDFLMDNDRGPELPEKAREAVRVMLQPSVLGVVLPDRINFSASSLALPLEWDELYRRGEGRILDGKRRPLLCRYLRWPKEDELEMGVISLAQPLGNDGKELPPIIPFRLPKLPSR